MYLVAYYYQKPANQRVRTARPGWMKDPRSTSWDERVAITRKLKNSDLSMAKVILDLDRQSVIRDNWGTQRSYTELFDYFHKNYPEHTKLFVQPIVAQQAEFAIPVNVAEEPIRVVTTG